MNPTRYRPALLAALLTVTLAVTTGCWPQPPTPAPPCTPAERPIDAYEFGDSLSSWAAHTIINPDTGQPHFTGICERFTSATGVGLSLNAMGGTRVDDHWPTMENIQPGTCVIVFLGTNSLTLRTLNQAEWDTLAALNILQEAGARRVVWSLLDENSASHRAAPALAETQGYNAFLEQLVADQTYGDLLTLSDWRATSTGHDDFLLLDRNDPVHHTDLGADAYSLQVLTAYQENCT